MNNNMDTIRPYNYTVTELTQ